MVEALFGSISSRNRTRCPSGGEGVNGKLPIVNPTKALQKAWFRLTGLTGLTKSQYKRIKKLSRRRYTRNSLTLLTPLTPARGRG